MKSVKIGLIVSLLLSSTYEVFPQSFTVLHSFTNSPDGIRPVGAMLQTGGVLYGTSSFGGTNNAGLIFSIGTNGSNYNVIHTFAPATLLGPFLFNSDGARPQSGLIMLGTNLIGITSTGGTNGRGAIFSMNIDGSAFGILHTFAAPSSEGTGAIGALTSDGNMLYGTAGAGGTNTDSSNGTVFSLAASGSNFTRLHTFSSGTGAQPVVTNVDGASPAGTLLLSGGTLYGTAQYGGVNTGGTIFSLNTNGSNFTTLHSFAPSSDGAKPAAGLIQYGNIFYGTTTTGGPGGYGTVFSISPLGSDFKVLHGFQGASDGSSVSVPLTMCGSMLFGVTGSGGPYGHGTLFCLTTNGSFFAVAHSFAGPDGATPTGGGMVLGGNTIYGTTYSGGASNDGTVFGLTIPSVVSAIRANPDASMTLNFAGAPFYNYLVQSTTNVALPGLWQTLSTNTAGPDGTWQFTDTNSPSIPSQFYRAVAQ